MTTFICILRGINVSGHRPVKMESLRAMFTELGFSNPRTYIQSGNVVFKAPESAEADLAAKISGIIRQRLGFEVPALVMTREYLLRITRNNPFITERNEDPSKLHVTFLAGDPATAALEKLSERTFAPDEFRTGERAVYLFCPNGYGNTKLSNAYLEKVLGTGATTRNYKTVGELLDLSSDAGNTL